MPEGPSLVIVKETLSPLIINKVIQYATGNAQINMALLERKKIANIRTWGKHLLICLSTCSIRIHFLMFGSYSIDEQTKPDSRVRLKLQFPKNTIYFYTCSVRLITTEIDALYDWEADVLHDQWNARKAKRKLKLLPDMMVCDALLDQRIFSGVGNIIKNEVLYRICLHPETKIKHLPPRKLSDLIREARLYSFDFLEWKRSFTLRKHWLAHTKKTCLRCQLPLIKNIVVKPGDAVFFVATAR